MGPQVFKINATFEGVLDEETVEFIKTDARFSSLSLEMAIAKLFITEMERNRETFGTRLMGLPKPEQLAVSVSSV